MEGLYKSAVAMSTQPWIEHFKHSVGKSAPWRTKSKMVLLRRNAMGAKAANTKSLPLNVVSPTEQFAEMAQASINKNTPTYKAPSVATHTSREVGGARARRSSKGKKKKDNRKSEERHRKKSHKEKKKSKSKSKPKSGSSEKKSKRRGKKATEATKTRGDIFT